MMGATTVTIGGEGTLFVGEDKIVELELVDDPDAASPVPVNMAGWEVLFDVRSKDASSTAIFTKTAAIVGIYNAVRASNTQRARVTLTDTEMNTVKQKTYRHSWKRMDDGVETVLARGPFTPEKATAP